MAKMVILIVAGGLMVSCAAPLRTDIVTFRPPSSYPNALIVEGLEIAVYPIVDQGECKKIFGTDLGKAGLLPILIIAHNKGKHEFEIDSSQVFGVDATGAMTMAYSLTKSAEKIRASSIGTTAVTGTLLGVLAGAAVGATVGAGIGYAVGDTETGATSGAIIGAVTGGAVGAEAGLSDEWSLKFKRELGEVAWGDKVVYPGDIVHGFVYLKWQPYRTIRVKVFDITANQFHELEFPIRVSK